MTSLKAYLVEFIGPLTEYPGTENEKGELQNAIGQALKLALAFPKKMAAVWAGHKIFKT